MSEAISLDIEGILSILPHRYPFLLVDRVEALIPGKSIRAYKNLTFNEPFFQGHFPCVPVMPGVLIIESMAQAGVLLVAHSFPEFQAKSEDHIYLFTGIEKARFRAPVRPGDRLVLECANLTHKMQLWKMDAKAHVDGVLVAEARLSASALPKEAF